MSDMQKEDKEKTEEIEDTGSVVSSSQTYLEGEVSETGWEVKLVKQDKTSLIFKVFCRDEEREWFQLIVKCPKKKFKRVGA
jgi:hypothetical protein